MNPWRYGTVPSALTEASLSRKMEPVERFLEVLPRFGCGGLLLHVSWHVDGLLYRPEDHRAARQDALVMLGGLPGLVGLALSESAQLHTHNLEPIEVFPEVAEYMRQELENGADPRSLELSGQKLLDLLPEHQHRPGLFVRLVYDLRGIVRYTRCLPRVETAKPSGHNRHPAPLDVLDAAEYLLTMREANGGRNPAASWSLNVPRRTAAEMVEHRAHVAARKRQRKQRQEARHRQRRQERRALIEPVRREVLERLRTARQPRPAPRHRAPRRCCLPGLPVRRVAACRPLLVGHARPPPRRRPRVLVNGPSGTRPPPENSRWNVVSEPPPSYHQQRPEEAKKGSVNRWTCSPDALPVT